MNDSCRSYRPLPPMTDFRIDTGTIGGLVSVRAVHLPTGCEGQAYGRSLVIVRNIAIQEAAAQLIVDADGNWSKRKHEWDPRTI